MAVLAPISGLPRFRNGRLVADARAHFYDAGTTTPRLIYQDAAGSPHANPVLVLGDGNFPAVYVQGSTAYKIRVEDGAGGLLGEYDQLQGEVSASSGGGGGGTTIPTGFEMAAYTTGAVAGWVRENGRTIGSAASGATERANADCEALFLHLWNGDANLAVSGGRGASAAADWSANKTIALPDARGRALVGLDDMGSTAAGRLTGGLFAFGAPTTLGSYGGVPTHILTTGQIPVHAHTGTATTTATTNDSGSHAHTGATLSTGEHAHSYSAPTGSNGSTASSGGPSGISGTFTGVAGEHSHTLAIDPSGLHSHTVSASTTVTIGNTGSGAEHNNLQPFALRTVYVKL